MDARLIKTAMIAIILVSVVYFVKMTLDVNATIRDRYIAPQSKPILIAGPIEIAIPPADPEPIVGPPIVEGLGDAPVLLTPEPFERIYGEPSMLTVRLHMKDWIDNALIVPIEPSDISIWDGRKLREGDRLFFVDERSVTSIRFTGATPDLEDKLSRFAYLFSLELLCMIRLGEVFPDRPDGPIVDIPEFAYLEDEYKALRKELISNDVRWSARNVQVSRKSIHSLLGGD